MKKSVAATKKSESRGSAARTLGRTAATLMTAGMIIGPRYGIVVGLLHDYFFDRARGFDRR